MPSCFERSGIRIPLDGMSEKVTQQEQALLWSHGMIDMDFRSVEIPRERVGNISGYDPNRIKMLKVNLNSSAVVCKWYCHSTYLVGKHVRNTESFVGVLTLWHEGARYQSQTTHEQDQHYKRIKKTCRPKIDVHVRNYPRQNK